MMDDAPTIEETHRAKDVYLRGMAANYPGVDPRMSLLGIKDSCGAYQTEGYGNRLVRIPSPWKVVLDSTLRGVGVGAIVALALQWLG